MAWWVTVLIYVVGTLGGEERKVADRGLLRGLRLDDILIALHRGE